MAPRSQLTPVGVQAASDTGMLGGQAEREHHVRQEIEREAGGDAADDHQRRAAAALHAQAEARGDQHHRGITGTAARAAR